MDKVADSNVFVTEKMERACDEAAAVGLDNGRIADVRQKARIVQAAQSRLKAAAAGVFAQEMERACDEAEAVGLDRRLIADIREKARRSRAASRVA